MYLILTAGETLGISTIAATYATFLISRGLDLFEVNLVNVFFFVTIITAEVPTGAIADTLGRRASFIASCGFHAVGMFAYAIGDSFWWFALAETIAAIGHTCMSGAFQAWLVDELKYHGSEEPLERILARGVQVQAIMSVFGAMGGAVIAHANPAFPWVAGGVASCVVGAVAILRMEERSFTRRPSSVRDGLRSMLAAIRVGIRYGQRDRAVRFILATGVVHAFAVQALNMQWQPFFAPHISGPFVLGIIYAGIAMSTTAGAAIAPYLLARLASERRTIVVALVVIGVGTIVAASASSLLVALPAFLLHEVGRGFHRPVKEAYLNRHIPSTERATILSVESFVWHLGGVVGLLASGWIAERVSIAASWFTSGSLLVVVAAWWLLRNGRAE